MCKKKKKKSLLQGRVQHDERKETEREGDNKEVKIWLDAILVVFTLETKVAWLFTIIEVLIAYL